MAAGGMQRGVYGRAESPYNADFLAAAFASGSSNGSAVSTTAFFAAFGLGEETVSSGRSPASNNAVVAYTPSRGNISTRGNWPLYSLCDVVVPHTRSVSDLFGLLDVITQPDAVTKGDFWRHQALVSLPQSWQDKPSSFYKLRDGPAFPKLRVAILDIYTTNANVGGDDIDGVYVSNAVLDLWNRAKTDLESLGADAVSVSAFPVVTQYEAHAHIGSEDKLGLPKNWKQVERSQLPALAWQEFLQENDDPNIKSLHGIESQDVWPFRDKSDPQVQFFKTENAVLWDDLSGYVTELAAQEPPITTQYQVPRAKAGCGCGRRVEKNTPRRLDGRASIRFRRLPRSRRCWARGRRRICRARAAYLDQRRQVQQWQSSTSTSWHSKHYGADGSHG